jgi:putative ABC transport system permease protein
MFRNYLKIAFRNISRNKAHTYINISGLAIGLATCLLIALYIFDEASYDKHHHDVDKLYRVASISSIKGETWAAAPAPLAWSLKNDLPEVQQVTRLMTFPFIQNMLLTYEHDGQKKQFYEPRGYYVDSTFFQLFTYDFIYGNPSSALDRPNSIVISDNIYNKFFTKNQDPVGKSIVISTPFGPATYTIKGVFSTAKYRSHIPANYLLSMNNGDMWNWVQQQTNWTNNNVFYTYLKLKPPADAKDFEKKLNPFLMRHAGDAMKAAGFSRTLFLQPVADIYLHSSLGGEIASNTKVTYLYLLGSIAVFVLLIACVNFMNLSTARSQKRAKEVGMRKVMGAEKKSLIWQFLGESVLMCFIALLAALIIARAALPLFNSFTGKELDPFDQPNFIFWIIGVTFLTGILSGIYPAFYLSAFKPVAILKGKVINSLSAATIRKGLVVFQFTISICLVIGAMVIWKQLDHIRNQNLGFEKTQKIIIPLQKSYNNSGSNYIALKDELSKNPAVQSVSAGSSYPGNPDMSDMLFYAEGKSINDVVDIQLAAVENDYIETMGFSLLSGRNFSKNSNADSLGIILNEEAVKELGYTIENAPGKKIRYEYNGHGTMEIVGVVKNFNFESLHKQIKPFGFTYGLFADKYNNVVANVKTTQYAELIQSMSKVWRSIIPNSPFTYSFLDQDFQRNYDKDRLTSRIVVYFTAIAIVIACLGLFGLSAFAAEQRTKEIGIRKVLGASMASVMGLLSKDFLRLVIIALLIACPLAWYFMNRWLDSFAYKTQISWWIFLGAGALAIFVAFVTISFQSIKTALSNPLKSLRTE